MTNKTKTNLLVDGISFFGFLAMSNPSLTGLPIHEWLGASFSASMDWFRTAVWVTHLSDRSTNEFSSINNNDQNLVRATSQTRPDEGFREHDEGSSIFGIFGAIGTALQIGLITLIVVSLQKGVKTLSRNRRINSNSYA